jgi:hypothetical protein
MGLFVEVESVEKGCKVIVNLDEVIEIAPLASGGCALFFSDPSSTGGSKTYKVKDSYEQFLQFAILPVSAEDIAKRFPSKKANKPVELDIPKL